MRSILLLLIATTTANADTRKPLGDGYELAIDQNAVFVTKGKQKARLVEGSGIDKVKVDKTKKQVDLDVTDSTCAGTTHYTWTLGHLDAAMENSDGYVLYKKKDVKGSIAPYARAVAADPKWKIPVINLASAYNLTGDKDAAMKALAPWIASDPIGTYVSVTTDNELASLIDRPEFVALRAKKAGNVTLDLTSMKPWVATSDKNLAVVHREHGWGASAWFADLEIYDAAGKLVTATRLVNMDETNPDCYDAKCSQFGSAKSLAAAKQRAARLQTMLNQLGFTVPALEPGSAVTTDDEKTKTTFAKSKIGVVVKDGTARILTGNTTLATAPVLDHLHEAVFLVDRRTIVMWSGRPGAEGCEGTDPEQVTVVALPKQP